MGLYLEHKNERHILRWILGGLFVIALLVGAWYTYKWFTTGQEPPLVPLPAAALADPSVDESPVTGEEIDDYTVPPTHPRYISIPALGVTRARVKPVGLTENNVLDAPKNISDTAWYDKSATPGQGYGAVVINGHNGGITRDGVFANLSSLKNGDKITLERGDGRKFTYAVVENRTESLKDANKTGMQRLMTPYDQTKEGLGLITCTGRWVPRDKVFDKRILVRAVAE